MKERITIADNFVSAAMKLGEGNPGALTVMMKFIDKAPIIDPDDFMGSFGALLSLDGYGIYGSRIWMLYKDVCEQDLNATLGMLRAVQMGIIHPTKLHHAINNHGKGLDVADTLTKLKARLPNFAITA